MLGGVARRSSGLAIGENILILYPVRPSTFRCFSGAGQGEERLLEVDWRVSTGRVAEFGVC